MTISKAGMGLQHAAQLPVAPNNLLLNQKELFKKKNGQHIVWSNIIKTIKSPEIISFAQNQIGFGEQIGTDFAESTSAATAFETIFVPIRFQGLKEVTIFDELATSGAQVTDDHWLLLVLLLLLLLLWMVVVTRDNGWKMLMMMLWNGHANRGR